MYKLFYGGICTFSAKGAFFEIAATTTIPIFTVIAYNEMARTCILKKRKKKYVARRNTSSINTEMI